MISLPTLITCGVQPTQARLVLDPLRRACEHYGIKSNARLAAFLGQCIVESGGFMRFEENCRWTTPSRIKAYFPSRVRDLQHATTLANNPKGLANCVYALKNGNGDEASGDGWNYRGRGPIQLTGLGNYLAAEKDTGRPYTKQPDLVALPEDGCLTAAWFWHTHKAADGTSLDALADAWQIDAITRVVNGPGMAEAALRRQRSQEVSNALTLLLSQPL